MQAMVQTYNTVYISNTVEQYIMSLQYTLNFKTTPIKLTVSQTAINAIDSHDEVKIIGAAEDSLVVHGGYLYIEDYSRRIKIDAPEEVSLIYKGIPNSFIREQELSYSACKYENYIYLYSIDNDEVNLIKFSAIFVNSIIHIPLGYNTRTQGFDSNFNAVSVENGYGFKYIFNTDSGQLVHIERSNIKPGNDGIHLTSYKSIKLDDDLSVIEEVDKQYVLYDFKDPRLVLTLAGTVGYIVEDRFIPSDADVDISTADFGYIYSNGRYYRTSVKLMKNIIDAFSI